ncbi:hypothetical protein D3C75_1282970 [compost metagenome]
MGEGLGFWFEAALVARAVIVALQVVEQLLLAAVGPHLLMTLVAREAGVRLAFAVNPLQPFAGVAVLAHRGPL